MNKDADRDLVLVSVFTFPTVTSWIFFELVKTAKTTTVSSAVQEVITPLNPQVDAGILTILESKQTYR